MGKRVNLTSTDVYKSHHSKKKKNIEKIEKEERKEGGNKNKERKRQRWAGGKEGRKAGEETRKFRVNLNLMFVHSS